MRFPILSLIACLGLFAAVSTSRAETAAPDSGTGALPESPPDRVPLPAEPAPPSAKPAPAALEPAPGPQTSPYRPRFRSDLLLPLLSVPVPGLGQYFQGQMLPGLAFTGVGAFGIRLYIEGMTDLLDEFEEAGDIPTDLTPEHPDIRKMLLGAQAYQGAGFLSAYGAFRAAMPLFHEDRDYAFLRGNRETMGDLLTAPARVGFLKRPTTWIPLGSLLALAGTGAYVYRDNRPGADWLFSPDDVAFSTAISYNAGVTEEALFRGYFFPLFHEYTGQVGWLANLLQASVFSLAHYSRENPYPWPQFLLGYYFGYLTQRNGWTLSEAAFNHFWWDAILLTASFLTLHRAEANFSFSHRF